MADGPNPAPCAGSELPACTETNTEPEGGGMIIEPHVHVWTLDTERSPWAPGTANPPARSATAEELIRTLDANGVSGAVLVQVIYYGFDNSYAADCLRRYPHRFA